MELLLFVNQNTYQKLLQRMQVGTVLRRLCRTRVARRALVARLKVQDADRDLYGCLEEVLIIGTSSPECKGVECKSMNICIWLSIWYVTLTRL